MLLCRLGVRAIIHKVDGRRNLKPMLSWCCLVKLASDAERTLCHAQVASGQVEVHAPLLIAGFTPMAHAYSIPTAVSCQLRRKPRHCVPCLCAFSLLSAVLLEHLQGPGYCLRQCLKRGVSRGCHRLRRMQSATWMGQGRIGRELLFGIRHH